MDFLNNVISLRQLSRAMSLGSLGVQIMLRSHNAFERLCFTGAESADGDMYFTKRRKRDKDARDQYFRRERGAARRSDDIFMLDVLREEMKRNDPRLQRDISI
jgi:hypothetical protein